MAYYFPSALRRTLNTTPKAPSPSFVKTSKSRIDVALSIFESI
jgi:hypothetical protein